MRRRVDSSRTSAPWIFTDPFDGLASPARIRSSVVFPAPLRPSSATTEPGADFESDVAQGGEVAEVFPDARRFRVRSCRALCRAPAIEQHASQAKNRERQAQHPVHARINAGGFFLELRLARVLVGRRAAASAFRNEPVPVIFTVYCGVSGVVDVRLGLRLLPQRFDAFAISVTVGGVTRRVTPSPCRILLENVSVGGRE